MFALMWYLVATTTQGTKFSFVSIKMVETFPFPKRPKWNISGITKHSNFHQNILEYRKIYQNITIYTKTISCIKLNLKLFINVVQFSLRKIQNIAFCYFNIFYFWNASETSQKFFEMFRNVLVSVDCRRTIWSVWATSCCAFCNVWILCSSSSSVKILGALPLR